METAGDGGNDDDDDDGSGGGAAGDGVIAIMTGSHRASRKSAGCTARFY